MFSSRALSGAPGRFLVWPSQIVSMFNFHFGPQPALRLLDPSWQLWKLRMIAAKHLQMQCRLYCTSRIPTSKWTGNGFETLILVEGRFNRKLRISSELQRSLIVRCDVSTLFGTWRSKFAKIFGGAVSKKKFVISRQFSFNICIIKTFWENCGTDKIHAHRTSRVDKTQRLPAKWCQRQSPFHYDVIPTSFLPPPPPPQKKKKPSVPQLSWNGH